MQRNLQEKLHRVTWPLGPFYTANFGRVECNSNNRYMKLNEVYHLIIYNIVLIAFDVPKIRRVKQALDEFFSSLDLCQVNYN